MIGRWPAVLFLGGTEEPIMPRLFVLLALLPSIGFAKTPPHALVLYSVEDNSTLEFTCREASDTEVDCDIVQRSLMVPNTAKVEAEYAAKDIEEFLKDKKRFNAANFAKFRQSCVKPERFPPLPRASSAGHLLAEQEEIEAGDELCECKDWRCFLEVKFAQEKENSLTTCVIGGSALGTFRFKQTSKNVWMYVSEPTGMCDIVLSMSLTYAPSKYDVDWKFVQVRLGSDREGEFCSRIEINKPQVYQWRVLDVVAPQCRRFVFSLI
jgi:hypothetical protein